LPRVNAKQFMTIIYILRQEEYIYSRDSIRGISLFCVRKDDKMKENIKTQIAVKGQEINVMRIDGKEYISLTDLARYADSEEPRYPIQNWMRNKDVILYLGLWEQINNENFKGVEFDTFKNEVGRNI